MKRFLTGILGCLLAAGLCLLLFRFFHETDPASSLEGRGIWQDKAELMALANGRPVPVYGTKKQLAAAAEKAMHQPIPLLTDKETVPPSGDKRDYVSLAVYYWPDPSRPDGKPYVRRDGRVNPEKWDDRRYDAHRFVQMKNTVKNLARGYLLTGKKAYAERALVITRAWFIDGTTRMNPRLPYAQMVPGRSSGRKTGLIDTMGLIDVVDALYFLRKECPEEEWQAYQKWFGAYTDWLLLSQPGKEEGEAGNNHGVWYDAQVCVFSHFAGKDEVAKKILAAVPEKRMASQIAEDGSLPLELARTRPLHYSLFTLRGFLTLARVGEEMGIDLYDRKSSNGRSLKLAIDYILPYAKGEKTISHEAAADDQDVPFWLSLHLANGHYKNPAYD